MIKVVINDFEQDSCQIPRLQQLGEATRALVVRMRRHACDAVVEMIGKENFSRYDYELLSVSTMVLNDRLVVNIAYKITVFA